MSLYSFWFLVTLLVAISLDQFVIGQVHNCCADLPGIIDGFNDVTDSLKQQVDLLKKQLADQQKEINDLKAEGKKPAPHDKRYQVLLSNQTWPQAKAACEGLGGKLATVGSQKEQDNIAALLKATVLKNAKQAEVCKNNWSEGGMQFHIGARRSADSCSAKWIWKGPGNKETDVTYFNWQAGEPSCDGYCVALIEPWGYKWNDSSCDQAGYGSLKCAVCEFD